MEATIHLSKQEFQQALQGFRGTENYYLHRIPNGMTMKLTDGCQFVRENAGSGAYWLFDLILSWQLKLKNNRFQVWRLIKQSNRTWFIECTDGNGNQLASQELVYSDFPVDQFELWYEDGVVLLPSEH